jgi:hypothetical protein
MVTGNVQMTNPTSPTHATHISKPSCARSVSVDGFVPVPRGALAGVPAPLCWPAKDPGDVLDYRLDIAAALVGNEGDGIATLDVVIFPANPGDLVLSSALADGSAAVLWLSGGQAGTTYTVTLAIGTSAGRMLSRSVALPVLALAAVAVPANGLVTDSGTPVTDQNGNPILLGG